MKKSLRSSVYQLGLDWWCGICVVCLCPLASFCFCWSPIYLDRNLVLLESWCMDDKQELFTDLLLIYWMSMSDKWAQPQLPQSCCFNQTGWHWACLNQAQALETHLVCCYFCCYLRLKQLYLMVDEACCCSESAFYFSCWARPVLLFWSKSMNSSQLNRSRTWWTSQTSCCCHWFYACSTSVIWLSLSKARSAVHLYHTMLGDWWILSSMGWNLVRGYAAVVYPQWSCHQSWLMPSTCVVRLRSLVSTWALSIAHSTSQEQPCFSS